nr:ribosome maturation factor RimP [uncultured Caproiciproducens sp.]
MNGLAYKKKNGNTVEIVRKLAEPIAAELGLSIWDVRFLKEGADWFLRIFIDKVGGVGIADCEAMSKAINGPLDELDPIEQAYCLEVSSPGIDRELVRDEHFTAFLGASVCVKLIRPMEDGRRELIAVLKNYRENTMVLQTEEGVNISLAAKDASSVRLVDDDIVGGIEE